MAARSPTERGELSHYDDFSIWLQSQIEDEAVRCAGERLVNCAIRIKSHQVGPRSARLTETLKSHQRSSKQFQSWVAKGLSSESYCQLIQWPVASKLWPL
jgi:hypothetical protein